ncbi:CDP-glycerol glycerophosphotransferase family protein [Fervidibacillus albus]|uniref:CDP-glycerol glycerophosphotransferase family protein n=1 Tax=Fervidibacillus albus TaxID=2980026 RepID=A0A9E8RVW9_9BACI|nr:CDP-glycerol glycerophosphotransferase family protein [Fervidibacillus albus]WAA09704.1 CDP-glycerol glycerophosphotransferase family protein [Fervidibacillus albus]
MEQIKGENLQNMEKLKLIPTLLIKVLVRFLYKIFCVIFPVNDKKVIFASYRSNEFQGNLLYLKNELDKIDPDYKVKILFKKFTPTIYGRFIYVFHMFKAIYHIATSSFVFIDDFYFPLYLIKLRKETKVIQVWHAAGAFKKFGYSTIGKSFGPSENYLKHVKVHSNYTYAVVSTEEVVPYYAEAFNMKEEKVLPLGVPRTDFILQEKNQSSVKKKLYKYYPQLNKKKLILYAPTFRGGSHEHGAVPLDLFLNIEKLQKELESDYALIIKLHPYVSQSLPEKGMNDFVFQLDDKFNTEEILLLSDILITDYSSIIFDYSLLERPIGFLATDLDQYIKERDFYYEYESFVPGPIFENTDELLVWIKSGKFNIEKVRSFSKRFFSFRDGKASERILKNILK